MAGRVAGLVLAVVLATALSATYSAELLVSRSRVQREAPAPVTLRLPNTVELVPHAVVAPGSAATPPPRVPADWRIRRTMIARGDIPSGADADLAEAWENTRRPLRWRVVAGLWVTYFLIGLLLFTYLRRFGSNTARLLRTQIGLTGLLIGMMLAAKALLLFTPVSEYLIPGAAIALWASLHIDKRAALLLNLTVAFAVASLVRFDETFVVVMLARGMGATMIFRDRKHPRSMVVAGIVGGFAGALMLIAARFFFEGTFPFTADIYARHQSALAACVGGGVLSGLLGWALHEPVGLLLGSVSRSKLVDLCDLEHPLLRKMAAEAPGSWQHSRAMANLAEDAAAVIGADTMLTRAGAYYHDLGKTIQSQYFVENLAPGERSPHEDLEPDVSADAIMAHVVGGVKILRDAGIPERVVEFAYTHHGTSVIEYFWHKCVQQGNPKNLSIDSFRYPGMKPQTRETAILMLIDAIEAASRTIDPPDREKFEQMVQRVIFTKLKQGQLDESGLSLDDVRVLATSIPDRLMSVYHHRIKYPWQNERREPQPPGVAEPTTPVPSPPVSAPPTISASAPPSTPAPAPAPAPAAVPASTPGGEASSEPAAEVVSSAPPGERASS